MGALFLFFITWFAPLAGGPLLGAAAYAGWFAPHEAFLLAWMARTLRPGDSRPLLVRAPGSAVRASILLTIGAVSAHLWFSLTPTAIRVPLVLLIWVAGLGWLGLTLEKPRLLKKWKIRQFPLEKPKWVLIFAAFFLVPLVGRVGSPEPLHGFVKAGLASASFELVGELNQIDTTPRGLSSIVRETRHLGLARRKGEPREVVLIRVRHDYSGSPTEISGVYNLSETAAVDESDLMVAGLWVAWRVGQSTGPEHLELANLSGEAEATGLGWDLWDRMQRFVTNIQETGQGRGIARSVVSWIPPSRINAFSLSRTDLEVTVGKESLTWALGGATGPLASEPALNIEAVPPAIPGSLVTWAVDRVRAISWIGSDRLQWIKAIAYRLATEAEDVSEQISATDPETQVAQELGDVWSRLPVVEESTFSGWPPAPLKPKLKLALPGEGQWIDLTHEKAFSALATPAMLFTFIRVDPKRDYNQVSIAIWDPRRIELHIVAGTEEPRSTLGNRGTGVIPRTPERVGRLVGAFNGAFQAIHGEFGMMEGKVVQLPPKPYAATVSTHTDGRVRIGTWPSAPIAIPDDMVSLRQNMTALVGPTGVNPYRRHWWGGVPEGWNDASRTVRSGLCKTREGYLAYFYSAAIDPERLAEAMTIARRDYGIHLDMNGGHAGFELYRVATSGKLPPVTRALDPSWEATGKVPGVADQVFNARLLVKQMPLMNFPRYIQSTPRDFFYLTERPILPGANLALPKPFAAGSWKTISTPGNEHPPFLVRSDVTQTEPQAIILSRIDPHQLVLGGKNPVIGFPAPEEGSLGLYFNKGTFEISPREIPGATLLVRGETTGNYGLCISEFGMLTIISGVRDEAELDVLVDALACSAVLRMKKPVALLLGEEARAAPVALARSKPFLAETLFPETPVVAPKVWGIPQATRATLVTARK